MPAENQDSNPGALLVSDIAVMTGAAAPYEGLETSYSQSGGEAIFTAASNHVDTPNNNNNWLPDGVHDLYNDGAVVWNPMSQVKVHYKFRSTFDYYAW